MGPKRAAATSLAAGSPSKQGRLHRVKQAIRDVPTPLMLAAGASLGLLAFLVRRRRKASRQRVQAAEEIKAKLHLPLGSVVNLQIPSAAAKAPFLLFATPQPLRVVMADISLPGVSLSTLWSHVFSNAAQFLAAFHRARRDLEYSQTLWLKSEGTACLASRTLTYATPLNNPLGPRQARNTEVMEVLQLSASGFVLSTRCTTEGVPFATNFANYLQWVATADAEGNTRLVITGECRFHTQVWGPLRGTIESESIKGMAKAYARFSRMLQEDLLHGGSGLGGSGLVGGKAGNSEGSLSADSINASANQLAAVLPGGMPTPRTLAALLTGSGGQQNTATLLVAIILVVLLYRISLVDTVALQMLRRLTGQYLPGVGLP